MSERNIAPADRTRCRTLKSSEWEIVLDCLRASDDRDAIHIANKLGMPDIENTIEETRDGYNQSVRSHRELQIEFTELEEENNALRSAIARSGGKP